MKVHDLKPAPGSTRERRRVGRGIGGKGGKTAGRGTKGQGARGSVKPGFEGGQMPLSRRVPKLKGFRNPFRVEYGVVNLDTLQEFDGDEVTPDTLLAKGLVHKHGLVKVLGRGELTRPIRVSAHGFSRSAEQAIVAAGGSVEVLPLPFGHGRPPAKGNALSNRLPGPPAREHHSAGPRLRSLPEHSWCRSIREPSETLHRLKNPRTTCFRA